MKNLFLFRVDGGKIWGVSTGHIARMLLLAKLLKSKFRIIFIMKDFPEGVSYVKEAGFTVETIDAQDDSDATLISFCEKFTPKKVIFDLYSNPYLDFFDYARNKNIRTIVFDVVNKCPGVPDILINDSLVDKFTSYKYLIAKTKIYRGPEYFLLDNPPVVVPVQREVKKIMLTMGGSDPANLTLKILNVLLRKNTSEDYLLNVVLGPLFQEKNKIIAFTKNFSYVRVLDSPSGFLNILSKQDIVITAAGRTLLECAYLGRPVIIIPSIDHEAVISSIFSEKTGAFDLGIWDRRSTPLKLLKSIAEYKNSYELRCSTHRANRRLIDGRGRERVLNIIGLE